MDRLRFSKKSVIVMVALLAVIIFCAAVLTALSFTPNQLSANAEDATTAPTVTDSKKGKVTLGELAQRHDVLYAVVPDSYVDGTEADADKADAQSLRDLQAAGKLTIYKASVALDTISSDSNGNAKVTLRGWHTDFDLANRIKVLLVVPNTITDINNGPDGSFTRNIGANTTILTGVAFESGSKVTEIPDALFKAQSNLQFVILSDSITKIGKQALAAPMLTDVVMPAVKEIGDQAFSGDQTAQLTSLYHITIPSTMEKISSDAFADTTALCDIENNSDNITAAQLSSLFPNAMNIYGSSKNNAAGGKSYLHVWESFGTAQSTGSSPEPEELKGNRQVNNSLVFSYNSKRSGVLATTTSGNVNYTNKWYFVALDGVEDKEDNFNWSQTTEYHFPATIDLTATREKITWDYLDSDGNKHVNVFSGATSVSNYDINANAAYNKRVRRIFLPEGVTAIGDYAFFGSQVGVLDIPSSVTHIGQSAFRQSHRFGIQHYYIRHKDLTKLNLGNYAFAAGAEWSTFRPSWAPGSGTPGGTGGSRRFIFANQAAYASVNNLSDKFNKVGDGNVSYTYLVPINTYTGTVAADNSVTTQKVGDTDYRLYGQNYSVTQNDDCTWTLKTGVPLPALDGYTSTVWYQESGDINSPTESKVAGIDYINGLLGSNATEQIDLYTKYIDKPDFTGREFEYVYSGTEMNFATALKFTDSDKVNYDAEFVNFRNAFFQESTQSSVENAGAYQIKVILNKQWGVWDDGDSAARTYTVNVARKEIDLGDINNIPTFVTELGVLGGNGTTIYEYSDGFYLYEKSGDEGYLDVYTVTNSYARYNGNSLTISSVDSEFALYKVNPVANTQAADAGRIISSFEFVIENSNYVFGNSSYTANRAEIEKRGISYNSGVQNSTTVQVSKTWYIVKQQNWLIDSEDAQADRYLMLTLNNDSVPSFVYETNLSSDGYKLHIPKTKYGADLDVTFTVIYGNNTPITVDANGALEAKPVSELSKYINAAMPVGTYKIAFKADGVIDESGNLPEINETVSLTVTAKAVDVSSVTGLLTGNTFEHAYNGGNLYLHDNIDSEIATINAGLNAVRKAAQANDNAWKDSAYDSYYNDLVISYNLDRMQTSAYKTLAEMNEWPNHTQVPREVGQYIVYYSLSAKNYTTIGGANASDRRTYTFNTVIYRELSTADFVFAEMEYDGSERKPTVPYSQYYTYDFNDTDGYINARNGATVTITLVDTLLSRWSTKNKPENVTIGANGVVTVTYNIKSKTNSWRVAPQMPSWTFNGFDYSVNVISWLLNFPDTTITFRVTNAKQNLTNQNYVGKDGKLLKDDSTDYLEFVISGNESINVESEEYKAFAKALNLLKPGTYYLESTVADYDNGNVTGFTTDGNQFATLIINKAYNRWTETPNIIRWTWNEYSSIKNLITATSLYPMDIKEVNGDAFDYGQNVGDIVYSILKSDGTTIDAILNSFSLVLNGDGTAWIVQSDIADILATLPAGDYILRTSREGTDYYTQIDDSDLRFNIAQAVNTWTTTPNVIRWTWGSYDENVNLINAQAKFDSYEEELESEIGAPVVMFTVLDSSFNKINKLVNFTAANGVVSEEIASVLAGLGWGTYYLVTSLQGRHNYSAINVGAISNDDGAYGFDDVDYNKTLQYVSFDIASANNYWQTTPRMSSFDYSQFVAESNFTAGVPHYPTDSKTVQYGIFNYEIILSADFVNAEDGYKFSAIDDDVEEYLNGLDAGKYYLVSYVPSDSNGNFSELFICREFDVNKAANAWVSGSVPSISGWTYGQFNGALFTDGSASHGKPVVYDIYLADNQGNIITKDGLPVVAEIDETELQGFNYNSLSDIIDKLGAGRYNLRAYVAETGNYKGVTHDIRFVVDKADNQWAEKHVPTIEGWTFGDAANSVTTESGEDPAVRYDSENVTISYEYYPARQIGGAWSADKIYGQIDPIDGDTGAGTYAIVIIADGSDNYNALEYTIFVTIAPCANSWTTEPEDRLDWTWGATSEIERFNLVEAKATEGEAYYTVLKIEDNKTTQLTIPEDKTVAEFLATLPVGSYRVTTKVDATGNYGEISKATSVTVSEATLTVTDPVCKGWTWGDEQKPFTDVTVTTVLSADNYLVKIVYVLDGYTYDPDAPNTWAGETDNYSAMLKALRNASAGTHTLKITVSCPNYNTVNKEIEITINKASFTWVANSKPANASWTWGDEQKTVVDPKATGVGGVQAVFNYVVNGAETPYTTFTALYDYLKSAPVDVYEVEVKLVASANYNLAEYNELDSDEAIFTVTVNKATNEWLSTITTSYDDEYEKVKNGSIVITDPTVKFGEVGYYSDEACSEKITNINAWIKALQPNDTTAYKFYMYVPADGGNYDAIKKEISVLITGTKSYWANKDTIVDDVNLTYSEDIIAKLTKELDTDKKLPYGVVGDGTTSYTLSYVNGSTTIKDVSIASIKDILDWIVAVDEGEKHAVVGTYTIKSHFAANRLGYTDLDHTLTLVIKQATPEWTTKLADEYNGSYGSIAVPTPAVGDYHAPITVTLNDRVITLKYGKDGYAIDTITTDEGSVDGFAGKTFGEYVKTLPAVTTYYTVRYSVVADDNYTGLNAETSRLYISPILNTWLDVKVSDDKTITSAQWGNGVEWTFTRGVDTITITIPKAVVGNETMTVKWGNNPAASVASFIAFMEEDVQSQPAGTYNVVFAIDQTANYNGLVSNCQVVINKKTNTWNTSFVGGYDGFGNVTIDDIGIPEAKIQIIGEGDNAVDLLRFSIARADGKYNKSNLTYDKFIDELADFANNTYTVIAYVGGVDYSQLTRYEQEVLDEHNANYNELTSVCVITLTPIENKWVWDEGKSFAGQSWTWGKFNPNSITMPVASVSDSNNTIVYTLRNESDNNVKDVIFRASKYGYDSENNKTAAEQIFDEFVNYLKILNAGTYSVTVSIEGTNVYYAPETLTAVYVVDKVVTAWTMTDTDLAKYEYFSGVWNEFKEQALPSMLGIANPWDGAKIIYSLDGVDLEDDAETLVDESNWAYKISHLDGAGVYTFKATVKGDINHTDLTFTARVTATAIQSYWDETTGNNNGKTYNWTANGSNNPEIDKPVVGKAASTDVTYYTLRVRGGSYIISSEDEQNDWSKVLEELEKQPVGDYIITAVVAADPTGNYTVLSYSVNVVISAAENSWKQHMNKENKDDFTITWTYGTVDSITHEATYGTVLYTVDGGKVADLATALKNLGAGDHAIVAYVDATTEYSGLSETIKLKIEKADNSWIVDDGQDKPLVISGWQWNDTNTTIDTFVVPVPAQGTMAIVTVIKGSETVLEATLSYTVLDEDKAVNANDVSALVRKLCALDVGTYTISVLVNETENYNALTTDAVEFKITQASNGWTSNGSPTIGGWSFGGDTAYPSATPKFGKNNVQFSYSEVLDDEKGEQVVEPTGTHEWSAAPSYTAGAYWLRAYVPGNDNYTELVGYYKFNINAAENKWVKMPGVVAWSWNGYDKDINLFSGSARSNKPAKFTITNKDDSDLFASDFSVYGGKIVLDDKTEIVINNSTIDTIRQALTNFVLGEDGKVSEKVAKILNALIPGEYRLTVRIDGGESLDPIDGYTDFTVGVANNEWKTAPNVLSYDYGSFDASVNFTAGQSKYGDVSYAVVSGDTYYGLSSNNNLVSSASEIVLTPTKVATLLSKLGAGNYTLRAWVAVGDTYNEFYSLSASYPVVFGVNRIENAWTTAQQNSIKAYYSDLHAMTDTEIKVWFTQKATKHNDEISYTLLYTNYTPAKHEENKPTVATVFTYEQLLSAILTLDSGDYVIRMTVKESDNYLDLSADTSLSINRNSNKFNTLPDKNIITGQWEQGNATSLDDFTVTAEHGTSTIKYTLGSNDPCDYEALKGLVNNLDAGSYQVTVTVGQTNEYEGLSLTLQLNVAQGENELTWSIESSWTWHDNDAADPFAAQQPKYGKQLTVEIVNADNTHSSSTITIDFSVSNPLAIINQVLFGAITSDGIVGGLDAGTYKIKVTASADTSWAEKTSEEVTFVIDKTPNSWTAAPALDNDKLNANVYKYEYGNAIIPNASAMHGVVKYTYYVNDAAYAQGKAEPLSGKPSNVGNYVVEISVDATTNYEGIEATKLYFDIGKVLNDGFVVSASAVGWTYGSYDRTVHKFTGIPRSEGKVTFTILKADKTTVVSINNVALDGMKLVGLTADDEEHYEDFDKDIYLEKYYAPLVAQLTAGSYYLRINVAETANNTKFTATAPFRVEVATNGWVTTPRIASWSLGLWDSDLNTPQAESRYGEARIVVTSKNNGEVFYDNMSKMDNDGNYIVLNRLENAPAGWYSMKVTVDALEGCYTGLGFDEAPVDVQVYKRGSNDTGNYWYEPYGIRGWEAIVGGIGNEPFGTPLRGLPYFEFYYATGEGSNAKIDWTRPVEEGKDSYLVEKGDNKYYKDFYVPMAPGYYYMVACAVNVDDEGNVIENDNLRYDTEEQLILLHIEYRANSFTDDPRIGTLLFLGDYDNWADPTATDALNGDVWFTYEDLEGNDLGSVPPKEEGTYYVVAHAKAAYSREIKKEAKFTVEKSTNEWTDIPTIDNWAEESEEKMLEWSSKYDADEIVYSYENVETGEKLDSKPTTEGTYKVTATIKKDGYHDLVGTTTFTIEPAYDPDLLKVDIALGIVACALAIFVIIFAIRRYKEN